MSDTIEVKGHCLCGSVQIEAKAVGPNVDACHCTTCRRWGGGPLMAISCGTDVSFSGGDRISIFNSSEWAERGFCSACGTHLFYRLKGTGEYYMPAGLFGDLEGFVFDQQVFVDRRPSFYQFANRTKEMTGAEVFALFAPDSQ